MTSPPDTADVVVVGAGAAGLAAAIAAAGAGADVVVLEENDDVGGHAILSGGIVQLGGGSRFQQSLGVDDSAEAVYEDWVSRPAGCLDDREIVWAFARHSADTADFLREAGVEFSESPLPQDPAGELWDRVPRRFRARPWPDAEAVPVPGRAGAGVIRPLERRARLLGVDIRTRCRLTGLEATVGGRVDVVHAIGEHGAVAVTARRGIVLATGGHSSDVSLRRSMDPRLTDVYQVVGEVYSRQSGDSERAALRHGAALWGVGAQTRGSAFALSKTVSVGCRWGYRNLVIGPDSTLFPQARATGIRIDDWSDVVLVGGAGVRFADERADGAAFIDAALACTAAAPGTNGGDPVWAVFDAAHAQRNGWPLDAQQVDRDGYFFEADSIEDLARAVRPAIGTGRLAPAMLRRTIERYNRFVAKGTDTDFGKRGMTRPIAAPPFYAAWATPLIHDSLAGLRIDETGCVLDLDGGRILGLYAAGESAGGFSQHGLGRALTFGRIAGLSAAEA